MSEIVIIVFAIVVPVAWLVAEFRGPRALRIALGLAFGALCLALGFFSGALRTQALLMHQLEAVAVIERSLQERLDHDGHFPTDGSFYTNLSTKTGIPIAGFTSSTMRFYFGIAGSREVDVVGIDGKVVVQWKGEAQ